MCRASELDLTTVCLNGLQYSTTLLSWTLTTDYDDNNGLQYNMRPTTA
jgi:hypothetical protein